MTLYFGLTEPVVRITSAVYEDSDYSIIGGILRFMRSGDYLLGFVIFVFSVVRVLLAEAALSALSRQRRLRSGAKCLGRAMARPVTRRHGGDLRVESGAV